MNTLDARDILENMLNFPKLNHLTKQEVKALNIAIEVLTSQSAKPGQAHIPASPCPADTLSTPHNSRHPGANDGEVNEDTRVVKKLCDCQFHLHPCQTIGKSAIPNPDCEKCHGTGYIDLDEVRKHKLSEKV